MNLISGDYDLPYCPPQAVMKNLMIACTQRTGSTLLAVKLWSTGTLGAPASYFRPSNMKIINETKGFATDEEFVKYLFTTRSSRNGVFSYKVLAPHWLALLKFTPFLFSKIQTRNVIFLRRRNQVAQAVSLYKAEMTGAYFSAGTLEDPEYSFEEILKRYETISAQNDLWTSIFETLEIEPLLVFYEDLSENLNNIVQSVREMMRVEADRPVKLRANLPALRRQANKTSHEWENKFRREAGLESLNSSETVPALKAL